MGELKSRGTTIPRQDPMRKAGRLSVRARRDMRERPRAEGGRVFRVALVQTPLLPLETRGREMLTDLGEQAHGGRWQVLRASVAVKTPHG